MKLGFTGTREGMSDEQRFRVAKVIQEHHPEEFHHGGCVGADKQAHDAWSLLRAGHGLSKTVVHPALVPQSLRASGLMLYSTDQQRRPEKPLTRNHNIVDETDVLIAAPRHDTEEMRSGTWATIRYARKQGKPVVIIYPDGSIES